MSTKAPRIPASVWNGYREEITALYTAPDGTLQKVMDAMKARHCFQPTKSQYLTKLNRWGLQKYTSGNTWTCVDQKLRKRDLEGKDSEIQINGKKKSRSEVRKEIARNVPLTSYLHYMEDVSTPEGVQVFTPRAEVASGLDIITPESVPIFTPSVEVSSDSDNYAPERSQVLPPGSEVSSGSDTSTLGTVQTLTPDAEVSSYPDIPAPESVRASSPSVEVTYDPIELQGVNIGNSRALGLQTDFFTSGANASFDSATFREVKINNLPWFSLQSGLQTLMVQRLHNQPLQSPICNLLDQPTSQVDILHNPQFEAKLLQVALGGTLKLKNSELFILTEDPKTTNRERRYLTSYFPPFDIEIGSTLKSMDPNIPSQLAAVQKFLQHFICLTNNDVLEESHIFNGVNWLLKTFNISLFTSIFSLRTTTSKIFVRKIFPAAVNSGNTSLVEAIIEELDPRNHDLAWSREYLEGLQTNCARIAVQNQDQRMLELLYKAGFRLPPLTDDGPSILNQRHLSWNKEKLGISPAPSSLNAGVHVITSVAPSSILLDCADSEVLRGMERFLIGKLGVNPYRAPYGTLLQGAILAEQLDIARSLIENGADVNAPNGKQYDSNIFRTFVAALLQDKDREKHYYKVKTPIQIACELNNRPLFDLLLAHGALVDPSPLSQLVTDNIIDYWISETSRPKSSVDQPDYKTREKIIPFHTALQYSVINGNTYFVHRLLSHGAHPDLRVIPEWGDTSLQMAARLNYPEMVSILVEKGADVNAPPGRVNGRTALQAAAEAGSLEIVQILLHRNANVNAPAGFRKGLTALQAAIKNGHFEIARLLLRSNADTNLGPSPNEDLSAIEAAVSQKSLSTLEFVLDHMSDNGKSMPAICAAAKSCWVDGARYLLKRGSNVNSFFYDSYNHGHQMIWDNINPLAYSIIKQDLEMVNLLLKSGAEVELPFDKTSDRQPDALCLALGQKCHPQIIMSLCQRYAELDSCCLNKDVLAMAVTYAHDECDSTVILRSIQSIMSRLSDALYSSHVVYAWDRLTYYIAETCKDEIDEDRMKSIIKFMLEIGAHIDARAYGGGTILQSAVKRRKMKVAEYLLEEGAEIQVPASDQIGTPLQEAIRVGELKFAHNLLERGADVNALPAPFGGFTALQAAATRSNLNIAVKLLQRGARVAAAAAPNYGITAINAAAEHGGEDMLQLLLNHYDGDETLWRVCQKAASHADRNGHLEIAKWLRGYGPPSVQDLDDIDVDPLDPNYLNVYAT